MPRPRRVYDPMTGAFDKRRSSEPMPIRETADHAYVPTPDLSFQDVTIARPGPHRRRGGEALAGIKGTRIA